MADVRYQDAEENGLWYPFKKVGDMIQEGDILGEVRDYEGKVKEVSDAEFDGVILYQTGTLQVVGNGPMVTYGRIVSRYDERKERIVNYWEKRSDSFLEQRRAELHSAMAEPLDEERSMHSFRKKVKSFVFWMWDAEQDFSRFFWQRQAIR